MVACVIEVTELTKNYGDTRAVDRLSFTVGPGRVTGFLGPNGAGKSTTMRMVLGLDRPTAGAVRIDGLAYPALGRPLHRVGGLLDPGAAHPGRTARDHLWWLARSNGIARSRVGEVLGAVGLESAAGKRVGTFSLGMRQRLGIAGALLGDPPVLLFDEPVNGLDPEGVLWMRNLMKRLAAEGRTVFVSSHLMSEMALTAEHLIVIGRGRLLADTSMAEFIDRNARSFVRIRTPDQERLRVALAAAGISAEPGAGGALEAVGADGAVVGEIASRAGVTVHEVSLQSASLEEAFMRLTGPEAQYRAAGGGA